MAQAKTIKPMASFNQLSDEDKVSVNAIILKIFMTAEPPAVIDTFQAGMNAASNATVKKSTSPDEGAKHKSKVFPKDVIQARDEAGQKLLDGLRDHLAALPVPKTIGDAGDIAHQRSALRSIKSYLASTTGGPDDEQIKAAANQAITVEKPKVFSGNVAEDKTIMMAVSKFQATGNLAKIAGIEASDHESLVPNAAIRAMASNNSPKLRS